ILYNRPILLVTVILLLALIMTLNYPTAFPQQANFAAILLDTAQGGILTMGMLVLLICGIFDLSAGSNMAISGIVAGTLVKYMGVPTSLSILAGICTGTIVGIVNGLIVTRLRINALITTLAMSGILRGITQMVSPSGVENLPQNFKPFGQTVILGLQSPFWVMIIIILLGWFLLSRVRFFRQFYYVGSNPKAATLSGIKVPKLMVVGFAIMGTLAGLAGTLLASRLSSAIVLAGNGVELRAITAALMGGASLAGGVGTVPGIFLGVLFMALIQNILIITRVPVYWQSVVVGVVLLTAIGIDQFRHK
ncbi:MAG: ABC transporter permease, partial [Anaerolineaceae bacterium]|nr:ABC transporter permease [Anaerolineaceae bacterium]